MNKGNDNSSFYRKNVAILPIKRGKVLLFERINHKDNWQFPQGGIDSGENLEDAMWRELHEETGIAKEHCSIAAQTKDFLYYDIPANLSRTKSKFKGQKQVWFLVEILGDDEIINLDTGTTPEFQGWCWASYWSCLTKVPDFKKEVYRQALLEFLPQAIKLGA